MKRSTLLVLGFALSSLIMSSTVVAGDDDYGSKHRHRHHGNHGDYYGYHESHFTYAKVLDVDPIIEIARTPYTRQQCWEERVVAPRRARHDAAGGMILGGIIGGVVGHQISEGRGNRDTATLIGTLVGASIGHDVSGHGDQPAATMVSQRCQNATYYDHDERIVGYRVTYRYRGQTFVTRTSQHPGSRIRVNVAVTPDD